MYCIAPPHVRCVFKARLYHCTRVAKILSIRCFLSTPSLILQLGYNLQLTLLTLLPSYNLPLTLNILHHPLRQQQHNYFGSLFIDIASSHLYALTNVLVPGDILALPSHIPEVKNTTQNNTLNMTTITTMASPARMPFASLGAARLKNMTNIKNKQNGRSTESFTCPLFGTTIRLSKVFKEIRG